MPRDQRVRREEARRREPIALPTAIQQTVVGQEQEREELHRREVQVLRHLLEAMRKEREDQARHERRPLVSAELPRE